MCINFLTGDPYSKNFVIRNKIILIISCVIAVASLIFALYALASEFKLDYTCNIICYFTAPLTLLSLYLITKTAQNI